MGVRYMYKLNIRNLNLYFNIFKFLGLQIFRCGSDNANVNSNTSYVANVGGNYNNNADNTGPFYVNVNNSASNTNSNIGGRSVAAYPCSGQYFYKNIAVIYRIYFKHKSYAYLW